MDFICILLFTKDKSKLCYKIVFQCLWEVWFFSGKVVHNYNKKVYTGLLCLIF